MTEIDLSWLGGLFDARGTINVTKSKNIIGIVTVNLSTELLKNVAISIIDSHGIFCNPASIVGKTYKLTFTSSRGTELLRIVRPYMKNEGLIRRADTYMRIFPVEIKGKHLKVHRLELYREWLSMIMEEEREQALT